MDRVTVVESGPGSGKTTWLAGRVQALRAAGTDPRDVLCLTFTVRAARALGARVGPDVTCSTTHALALALLEERADLVGRRPGMTVYDEDDAWALWEWTARDLGLLRGIRWTVPAAVARSAHRGEEVAAPHGERLAGLREEYGRRLARANALDYDRLLPLALESLGRIPARWTHVLVDEAQDLEPAQWDLVERVTGEALTLVGDPDQAIYGWRGATPGRMRRPGAEVVDLGASWRCGPGTVQAANALLVAGGGKPRLTVHPGRGERPDRVEARVGRTEEVGEVVRELAAEGYAPGDVAVLGRTRRICARAARALGDVPHHLAGGPGDRAEGDAYRRLGAALRLVRNPADEVALLRLRPLLDATDDQVREARVRAAERGCALTEALRGTSTILGHLRDLWPGDPPARVWAVLGPALATLDAGERAVHDAARERIDSAVGRLTSHEAAVALAFAGEEPEEGGGAVTVSTIHGAKGLEWPAVIVLGCNEGGIPSTLAEREGRVEEERRVCYVALTRARERTVCLYAPAEHGDLPRPSRFLRDAGLIG